MFVSTIVNSLKHALEQYCGWGHPCDQVLGTIQRCVALNVTILCRQLNMHIPAKVVNTQLIFFYFRSKWMDEEQLWIKSDNSLRSVTMVSRRKILSRSRDDLNLEAPPEEEEDIWYNRDKLYKVSDTEMMKNIIFQHYCCSVWYCIHKINATTVWLKEDDNSNCG